MPGQVNAGARLDRLPFSSFHRRIMALIGVGMFFDGFDLYIAAAVLGATLQSGFSTLQQNAQFISATFLGMMIGSFLTGFLGDRYGRRFTYQFNLAIFGVASVLSAFAPNMETLIALRFFIGVGLGAEIVVGYGTMTEFVPPQSRGKWLGFTAFLVISGLPATILFARGLAWAMGLFGAPALTWRAMFIIGGVGALVVWWLRKRLPESPRWLESVGRNADAEALVSAIEKEVSAGAPLPLPLPLPPAPVPEHKLGSLLSPPLLGRMIVGSVSLVVINTLIFGFVTWLPTFFVKQGMSIVQSYNYTLIIALGAPAGAAIGALSSDRWGRRRTIAISAALAMVFGAIYPFVSDPVLLPVAGLALMIPIYILTALLYGIYVPELFPTELRLRATGICNTFGRGATIVTPFIVVPLFVNFGVGGVLSLMIALLALEILVVLTIGIEPGGRRLEELASGEALGAGAAGD